MSDAAATVSDYWAIDRTKDRVSWLQHPTIMGYVNRRVSGNSSVSTMEWFAQKYVRRAANLALSLGCGFGGFERDAIKVSLARKIHANDISEGAIAKAREYAAEAGMADKIEYSVLNLDEVTLPAETYDVIFALSSAHHVLKLENLFEQCHKALKPDGILFLDEYIGPSRFQTPPKVTEMINRLRNILPEKYRKSLFANDGSLIRQYIPSPIEHFEKNDPSEAVRSGEIISTLKFHFDIVDYRPYGGAILHMLLSGITGNFDEKNETDVALINMLTAFEEAMEGAGAIGSDFAAIVAKPRAVIGQRAEHA